MFIYLCAQTLKTIKNQYGPSPIIKLAMPLLSHAHTSMEQLGNDHTVNGTVSPLQKPLKNLT